MRKNGEWDEKENAEQWRAEQREADAAEAIDAGKRDKLVEKLAKLRAMAEGAESVGNEKEAEAFAGMFQHLLLKHKIEMTEVDMAAMETSEPISSHRIDYSAYPGIKMRKRRIEWIETLAAVIANAYFCRVLVHPGSSRITLVGRRSDTTIAEYMIVTLQRAIDKIATREQTRWDHELHKKTGRWGGPEHHGFKGSFINAFISRLSQRFEEERRAMGGESSTALVRINKAERDVVEWIEGNIKKKATDLSTNVRFHREGVRRGREAAERIDLKTNVIDQETTQRRKLSMSETMKLYRAEFKRYLEAGDDSMNARLRIIERGCPVEVAEQIEREEGDDDDADE